MLESTLLALLVIWLVGGDAPVVVDYRLLAIQYLPGGLLASLWAAMRLHKLAPGRTGRQLLRRLVLTPLAGGLFTGWVVLTALGFSLLHYSLSDLSAPVVPELFDNPYNQIISNLAGAITPLLSWPGQFDPANPAWLIVVVRVLVYTGELTILFLLVRLVVGLLAVPGRWLRRLNQRRLLWRLTFSHFWVVLLSLAAAGLALIGLLLSPPTRTRPDAQTSGHNVASYAASTVASTLRLENLSSPLLPTEISAFLRQVAFNPFEPGDLNLTTFNPPSRVRDMVRELPPINSVIGLSRPQFIVVTDLQGQIVASSSPVRLPVGKAFLDTDLARLAPTSWASIINQARTGNTNLAQLMATQTGPPLVIAGGYPVLDRAGRPSQIVLLAEPPEVAVLYSSQGLLGLLGVSAFFLVGTLALSFTTVFVALLFGYLSSRRLVRGLERLASAADALAIGKLGQRVPLDGQDEVNGWPLASI